jgi:hypothetical protein
VLRAPLTVEGITTVEVAKVSVMGRVLVVSSYIDRERVAMGGSRLRSKTRRCGDVGKAAVRRPYRRKRGARWGGEARSDSRDSGVLARAVGRCSDSEAAAQLGQRRGVASDSGAIGQRLYGTGTAYGHVSPAQRVARQVEAAH